VEWNAQCSPLVKTGSFAIGRAVLSKTTQSRLHEHSDAHFVIVCDGCWEDVGSAGRWSVGAGQILLHPPGVKHRVRAAAAGTEIICVSIAPLLITRFAALYGRNTRSEIFRWERFEGIPDLLQRELLFPDAATPLMVEGLILHFLALGSRYVSPLDAAPSWVRRAVELMTARFAEPLSVPDLANAVGISHSRFAHGFTSIVGQSPGDFLRAVRVRQAARALRESDEPIAEIATAAGFYDQAHLSKAFRIVKAMTPRQYRVNSRKRR
jgi:AraC family transcriptional regulator